MDVQPSVTLTIANLLKAKKAQGEEVFDLGVGEIIGLKSQEVLEAVKSKLTETATWQYPAVAGFSELREAAVTWYNEEYQTNYSAQNVLVTTGGKFAMFILLQVLLMERDEVLIPAPYWVSYPEIIKLFKGVPKFITTTQADDWKISVDSLEKAWTPKTKILILNSINNPTGTIYNPAELKAILNWAADKKLIVISDEVYSELVFNDSQKFFSCGAFKTGGQIIVVQSCSKNFAMSGWRVGFIFGDTEIIKQTSAIQSQSTTGVPPICQQAAWSAITARKSIQKNIKIELIKRRDELINGLNDYFNLKISAPMTGLYLFISLKDLGVKNDDSIVFAQNLLAQSNVAVVPGQAFGVEGYLRLSFGSPEAEIKEGLRRLALFIKGLN